ncbi:unnamed protein product, partial [Closterium sp. NIES-53]
SPLIHLIGVDLALISQTRNDATSVAHLVAMGDSAARGSRGGFNHCGCLVRSFPVIATCQKQVSTGKAPPDVPLPFCLRLRLPLIALLDLRAQQSAQPDLRALLALPLPFPLFPLIPLLDPRAQQSAQQYLRPLCALPFPFPLLSFIPPLDLCAQQSAQQYFCALCAFTFPFPLLPLIPLLDLRAQQSAQQHLRALRALLAFPLPLPAPLIPLAPPTAAGARASSRGILSTDPRVNPTFHNWNLVRFVYCDGGGYAGRVRWKPVNSSLIVYLDGWRISKAIFMDLRTRRGLTSATNIIMSGSSAGGQAVVTLCDQLAEMAPAARTKCLMDSGFFIDSPDRAGVYSFRAMAQRLVGLHQSLGNPRCQR